MDKLFEPGAVYLADPRGDPNRVIEVQQKVEALLGANRQRQEGIKQELLEQGAWALPGLMNATYVWMNRLENSPPDQELLSSLMAQLAADNSAAAELLFRYGVLETPFPTPRAIAQKALGKMQWRPTEANRQALREKIARHQQLEDTRTVIDLYAILLKSGQDEDFRKALALCETWARQSLEPAGQLLAQLTRVFPERTGEILSRVFLAVKSNYKDRNIANMLITPLRPIPPFWLREDVLLKVSQDVLPKIPSGRHTAVEYLWIDAVSDCKQDNPDSWQELLEELDHQLQQENNETVYRYWFEAVGKVGAVNYIARQARAESRNADWRVRAIAQLFFLQRNNRQATQLLKDLQSEYPRLHESALRLYEIITGGSGKTWGDIEGERGIADLR